MMSLSLASNRTTAHSSFPHQLQALDLDLRQASDPELLVRTETAVREEREKLTVVLYHLREVDRRRLYSTLKYASLYEYASKHFHYTEREAYSRISAMQLLKALPEVEEKVNSGALSLTHLNIAQTFFNQEEKLQQKPLSKEEKVQLIEKLSDTSTREAQKITLSLSSAEIKIKPDQFKLVTENRIEVRFTAREQVQPKTEKLKGFLAHSHPGISLGELYEKLCDLGLEHWDPARPPRKSMTKQRPQKIETKADKAQSHTEKSEQPEKMKKASEEFTAQKESCVREDQQAFSAREDSCIKEQKSKAQIRREVFQRAGNQCENCHSEYALEIDHILPQAMGGSSKPENLRLLCRYCNQRAAIDAFGQQKMDFYLSS
jgi:5-methylcytosine-specific restriction endonuclease McrA